MPIIYNQYKGTKAIVSVVATSETYQPSDFSQSSTDQNGRVSIDSINNFAINKIIHSGTVTVSRGSNVVYTSTNTSCAMTFDAWGMSLNQYAAANITITTSAGSTAFVELRKAWTGNTAY